MNHIIKTKYVLAFYNSFLKTDLNCDEEIMLILNTHSFRRKILSTLESVMIYLLTNCVLEDVLKTAVLETL